jgi:hypothetical protein
LTALLAASETHQRVRIGAALVQRVGAGLLEQRDHLGGAAHRCGLHAFERIPAAQLVREGLGEIARAPAKGAATRHGRLLRSVRDPAVLVSRPGSDHAMVDQHFLFRQSR